MYSTKKSRPNLSSCSYIVHSNTSHTQAPNSNDCLTTAGYPVNYATRGGSPVGWGLPSQEEWQVEVLPLSTTGTGDGASPHQLGDVLAWEDTESTEVIGTKCVIIEDGHHENCSFCVEGV